MQTPPLIGASPTADTLCDSQPDKNHTIQILKKTPLIPQTQLHSYVHLTSLIHHPFHSCSLENTQRHLLCPSFPRRVRLQHPLQKGKKNSSDSCSYRLSVGLLPMFFHSNTMLMCDLYGVIYSAGQSKRDKRIVTRTQGIFIRTAVCAINTLSPSPWEKDLHHCINMSRILPVQK